MNKEIRSKQLQDEEVVEVQVFNAKAKSSDPYYNYDPTTSFTAIAPVDILPDPGTSPLTIAAPINKINKSTDNYVNVLN